jgi:hypothetical protein
MLGFFCKRKRKELVIVAIQYDLFEEQSELNDLRKEVAEIKKSADNVRRGLFARHSEMSKLILKQQNEIEELRNLVNEKRCESNVSKTKNDAGSH